MKNIGILRTVHKDFRPLSLLCSPAVSSLGLLPMTHGSPLTAGVPHDLALWEDGTRSLEENSEKDVGNLEEHLVHLILLGRVVR